VALWTTGVRFPAETGSGAYSASYPVDTGALSPNIKRPDVKLITYLHLLPRLRMRGALLPFDMSSCRGA